MKYLLTLASALVVFASSAQACPFKDKQHASSQTEQTPMLASQDQRESSETELTDAELLLLLQQQAQPISYN